MENILDRLSMYMKMKGLNNNKITVQTGLSNGLLGNAFKSGKGLNSDSIEKILCYYTDINAEWLLTGKGDMIKSTSIQVNEPVVTYNKKSNYEKILESQSVPLYDITAAAGFTQLMADRKQNIIDRIKIPNIQKSDGAVFITGDSMYPLLKSGDIVLFKIINNMDYLQFGDMYIISYAIDGDERIVVKYVQRSDVSKHVKLVSYNTHHEPIDIPVYCINSIAIVQASIRYNTM